MSDVLRDLADLLDQKAVGDVAKSDSFLEPVQVAQPDGDDTSDVGKFVPPLQAKIELLKRSTGMDNAIDKTDQDGDPDELDQIKKLANIQVQRAVHIDQLADDDGPFEG